MAQAERNLVGVGVYTVPEAAAIAGVAPASIHRWIRGYAFTYKGEKRRSEAVWHPDIPPLDNRHGLSFLDMMEARFIQAFRNAHVSWGAIREAAALAKSMFDDPHPFTRKQFRTDGKRIFAQIEEEGAVKMFDMNRRSWVFNEIVAPSLYRGVEFEQDQLARWYPLHPRKAILIDPQIGFGRPIVASCGIPTEVLASAAEAEGSPEAAAAWYKVARGDVLAAVEYERQVASRISRTAH